MSECSRWQVRNHFQHTPRVQKQAVPTAVAASDPWLQQVKSLEPLQLEFRGMRGPEDQSRERPIDAEKNRDVEGMDLDGHPKQAHARRSPAGTSCSQFRETTDVYDWFGGRQDAR